MKIVKDQEYQFNSNRRSDKHFGSHNDRRGYNSAANNHKSIFNNNTKCSANCYTYREDIHNKCPYVNKQCPIYNIQAINNRKQDKHYIFNDIGARDHNCANNKLYTISNTTTKSNNNCLRHFHKHCRATKRHNTRSVYHSQFNSNKSTYREDIHNKCPYVNKQCPIYNIQAINNRKQDKHYIFNDIGARDHNCANNKLNTISNTTTKSNNNCLRHFHKHCRATKRHNTCSVYHSQFNSNRSTYREDIHNKCPYVNKQCPIYNIQAINNRKQDKHYIFNDIGARDHNCANNKLYTISNTTTKSNNNCLRHFHKHCRATKRHNTRSVYHSQFNTINNRKQDKHYIFNDIGARDHNCANNKLYTISNTTTKSNNNCLRHFHKHCRTTKRHNTRSVYHSQFNSNRRSDKHFGSHNDRRGYNSAANNHKSISNNNTKSSANSINNRKQDKHYIFNDIGARDHNCANNKLYTISNTTTKSNNNCLRHFHKHCRATKRHNTRSVNHSQFNSNRSTYREDIHNKCPYVNKQCPIYNIQAINNRKQDKHYIFNDIGARDHNCANNKLYTISNTTTKSNNNCLRHFHKHCRATKRHNTRSVYHSQFNSNRSTYREDIHNKCPYVNKQCPIHNIQAINNRKQDKHYIFNDIGARDHNCANNKLNTISNTTAKSNNNCLRHFHKHCRATKRHNTRSVYHSQFNSNRRSDKHFGSHNDRRGYNSAANNHKSNSINNTKCSANSINNRKQDKHYIFNDIGARDHNCANNKLNTISNTTTKSNNNCLRHFHKHCRATKRHNTRSVYHSQFNSNRRSDKHFVSHNDRRAYNSAANNHKSISNNNTKCSANCYNYREDIHNKCPYVNRQCPIYNIQAINNRKQDKHYIFNDIGARDHNCANNKLYTISNTTTKSNNNCLRHFHKHCRATKRHNTRSVYHSQFNSNRRSDKHFGSHNDRRGYNSAANNHKSISINNTKCSANCYNYREDIHNKCPYVNKQCPIYNIQAINNRKQDKHYIFNDIGARDHNCANNKLNSISNTTTKSNNNCLRHFHKHCRATKRHNTRSVYHSQFNSNRRSDKHFGSHNDRRSYNSAANNHKSISINNTKCSANSTTEKISTTSVVTSTSKAPSTTFKPSTTESKTSTTSSVTSTQETTTVQTTSATQPPTPSQNPTITTTRAPSTTFNPTTTEATTEKISTTSVVTSTSKAPSTTFKPSTTESKTSTTSSVTSTQETTTVQTTSSTAEATTETNPPSTTFSSATTERQTSTTSANTTTQETATHSFFYSNYREDIHNQCRDIDKQSTIYDIQTVNDRNSATTERQTSTTSANTTTQETATVSPKGVSDLSTTTQLPTTSTPSSTATTEKISTTSVAEATTETNPPSTTFSSATTERQTSTTSANTTTQETATHSFFYSNYREDIHNQCRDIDKQSTIYDIQTVNNRNDGKSDKHRTCSYNYTRNDNHSNNNNQRTADNSTAFNNCHSVFCNYYGETHYNKQWPIHHFQSNDTKHGYHYIFSNIYTGDHNRTTNKQNRVFHVF
ncbi:putative uncharacterized protein DDB_G0282133 [Chanos chanos]|uniref:Uncharacterized protein n=1 Tax=Chanos chanos TaxID=29144 RepID=A0A6J2WK70_CHACN|nr:putative uncharacterized protein DDB_G0282133 [Chanos chanos]